MDRFFERWTPSGASPAQARHVRVVVATGLLALTLVCVLSVVYAAAGDQLLLVANLIAAVAVGIGLAVVRRRGAQLGGQCILVGTWVSLSFAIAISGGIQARFALWMVVLPLVGGLLGGLRSGVAWTGITALTLLSMLGMHLAGLPLPQLKPIHGQPLSDIVVQTFVILTAVAGTMLVFVGNQAWAEARMVGAIEELEAEVAARTAAEAELRSSLEARSRFLATVSHELRTPMAGVVGVAELLVSEGLSSEQQRMVGSIQSSGALLLRLLNDILDASKIDAGELELEPRPFPLAETIEESARLLEPRAYEKGLRLLLHLEPDLPAQVVGDRVRLQQMVMNYLSNAIKFTTSGHIRLHARYTHGRLSVAVHDTGIGIAPQHQERLFQPYQQATVSTARLYGGTGLGLSIVRALAEAMNGSVSVDSTPGTSSTFRFEVALPLHAPATPHVPPEPTLLWVVDPLPEAGAALAATAQSQGVSTRVFSDPSAFQEAWADDSPRPDWLVVHHTLVRDGSGGLLTWVSQEGGADQVRCCVSVPRGGGTRHDFTTTGTRQIELPLTRDTAAQLWGPRVEPAPSAARDVGCRGHVLVVDDNAVNRMVIGKQVERAGFSVETACDGRAAIERVRTATDFDAILMDVHMPILDGLDATRLLRRRFGSALHIVGVTASALPEDHAICLAAGMDATLDKPVSTAVLHEHLDQLPPRMEAAGTPR